MLPVLHRVLNKGCGARGHRRSTTTSRSRARRARARMRPAAPRRRRSANAARPSPYLPTSAGTPAPLCVLAEVGLGLDVGVAAQPNPSLPTSANTPASDCGRAG